MDLYTIQPYNEILLATKRKKALQWIAQIHLKNNMLSEKSQKDDILYGIRNFKIENPRYGERIVPNILP